MKSVNIEGKNKTVKEKLVELEAKDFKKALIFTLDYFTKFKEELNELNIFPVPDGDTGTNMYLTLATAVDNIRELESDSVAEVVEELAAGALLGGRGNSGVIFSQLLRGMAEALEGQQKVGTKELAAGLDKAAQKAYQGVMKPVEGTILTVAREVADRALEIAEQEKEIGIFLTAIVKQAKQSVIKTPELLAALAEAGVVDAGAKGYAVFWEGIYKYYLSKNEEVEELESVSQTQATFKNEEVATAEQVELEYNYCLEFVIKEVEVNCKEVTDLLQTDGDSLLVVEAQDFIKVHIHSNHPGLVLEKALEQGELSRIKIDNMLEEVHQTKLLQASEQLAAQSVAKEIGVIAVAKGVGLKEIFENLGVDLLVTGGQSMNPSTQDFVKAIEELDREQIIILPNNKNIISAAEQVLDILEQEVIVLPTTSIPQGIAAMMGFNAHGELEEVKDLMLEELEEVKSGEVTYSVRDSLVEGQKIKQGDILGLIEGEIKVLSDSPEQAVLELLEELVEEQDFLITIYSGAEVVEDELAQLKIKLEEKFAELELEIHNGGQELYYYLVSVE